MDLLSKDSIITNINDVESILASKYNYINAYNKLNSSEKNNAEVKEINTNKKWTIIYDNIYITEKDNHIFKENIAYLNSYQQDYNYIDLGI